MAHLHHPESPSSTAVVLTHGAGANADAPLLIAIAESFQAAGVLVYRYNLPFRTQRPHGPPHPSSAHADRAGIAAAISYVRTLGPTRILAGGHSYGGRQTTMAAADNPELADGLLLLSYPLHPPKKPDQLRTGHLAQLRTPSLFIHGSRDPFGSEAEMRAALALIPARNSLSMIQGAGHDLGNRARAAEFILGEARSFFTIGAA